MFWPYVLWSFCALALVSNPVFVLNTLTHTRPKFAYTPGETRRRLTKAARALWSGPTNEGPWPETTEEMQLSWIMLVFVYVRAKGMFHSATFREHTTQKICFKKTTCYV
jgi:hypothetical protein